MAQYKDIIIDIVLAFIVLSFVIIFKFYLKKHTTKAPFFKRILAKSNPYLIAEYIILIGGIVLWVAWPNKIIRDLSVALNPGENRIVYFVPGDLAKVNILEKNTDFNVRSEKFEKGTILLLQIDHADFAIGDTCHISIEFYYRGAGVRRQEKLSETMSSVQWVKNGSQYIYPDFEEGYCFGSANYGTDESGYYSEKEVLQNDVKMYFLYISIGAAAILFLGEPTVIRKRPDKKRNSIKDDLSLEHFLKSYLDQHADREIPDEIRKWTAKIIKKYKKMIYRAYRCLIFSTITGGLVFHTSLLSLFLFEILFVLLWVLTSAFAVWKYQRKINKKVAEINKMNPMAAMWCRYELNDVYGGGKKWGLSDLRFAEFMLKNQDYEAALFWSDKIWNLYGKKNKGWWYLEYHYLQFSSFHFLNKKEEEEYHLNIVKKELKENSGRFFNKSFYTRISKEVSNISGEE